MWQLLANICPLQVCHEWQHATILTIYETVPLTIYVAIVGKYLPSARMPAWQGRKCRMTCHTYINTEVTTHSPPPPPPLVWNSSQLVPNHVFVCRPSTIVTNLLGVFSVKNSLLKMAFYSWLYACKMVRFLRWKKGQKVEKRQKFLGDENLILKESKILIT
jgi:hypothetical protein